MTAPAIGFFEQLFCQHNGSHCIRPTGVERQMSDSLYQFFFFDSVFHGLTYVRVLALNTMRISLCSSLANVGL